VNRRIIAATTVLAIWATVGVVITRGSEDSPVYEIPASSAPLWEREASYIWGANSSRLPAGPENIVQVPYKNTNPNRVRVLVVGDSATYGHGVTDLDSRWWERLGHELDERTEPGTFEIIALGQNGASMFRYADWLTKERIAQLNPDLILIALNGNDGVPTGDETAVCPDGGCEPIRYLETDETFNTCMRASSRLPAADQPALHNRCTKEADRANGGSLPSQIDVLAVTDDYPYQRAFESSLSTITENAGGIAIGVLPMLSQRIDNEAYDTLGERIVKAGWTVSPLRSTRQILSDTPDDPDLLAHPLDRHPGPLATAAMATDGADLVLGMLASERLAKARDTATGSERLLISNYLPSRLRVDQSSVKAKVNVLVRPPDATSFGNQFIPCARIGRGHIELMLNPTLRPGSRVSMSNVTQPVDVFAIGYSGDQRRKVRMIGQLEPGNVLDFTIGEYGLRGILVAERDAASCTDEVIDLKRTLDFELDIKS